MITVAGVTYGYAGGGSIGPIDLVVPTGQLVVLVGATGSGKSTLLRLLAGITGRHGRGVRAGTIAIDGVDPAASAPSERISVVGFVGQDPDDATLAGTVADEIAFPLESARWPSRRIAERVDAVIARHRLVGPDRELDAMSGGERQRVAVAAAVAGGAKVLLLDEPMAHLDPSAAVALAEVLRGLVDEGLTVVIAEHRLEALWSHADRLVVLDRGLVAADGPPAELVAQLSALGLAVPRAFVTRPSPRPTRPIGAEVLAVAPAVVRIGGRVVLELGAMSIRAGERIALIGPNGAGKSTLLRELARQADLRGVRAVSVPQDPDDVLIAATVAEEIGLGGHPVDVDALEIASFLDRPPASLSRGQRLRVAVAAALATRPQILMLDEPTAGQDRAGTQAVLGSVDAALQGTAIFATHDVDLAMRTADRVWVVDGGRVVADGPPAPITLPAAVEPAPLPSSRSATGLDPRTRLLILGAAAILVVALDRPLALSALAAAALIAFLGTPKKSVGAALALAAVVYSTVLSQALFYAGFPRTPIVSLGPITLWYEGFAWGALQAMRTASLGLLGLWVVGTTPPDRMVVALIGLGVPGPIALLSASALRFAPELARRAGLARSAYIARTGRSPGIIGGVSLLVPILARALRRAQALAELLDARGFDPAVIRTQRVSPRFGVADYALLAGILPTAVAAVGARLLYAAYVGDLWWHPALKPLYGFVRGWL